MKRYAILMLNILAFFTTLFLIVGHFEYAGIKTILATLLTIIAGYWLGAWTCHFHKNGRGLWITLAIFILLNLFHSMIDGTSIGELDAFGKGLAVLFHEAARQPALYVVLWSMLAPFPALKTSRLLLIPLSVTGVWVLGAYLGFEFFHTLEKISWLEFLADQALFLFLGDIIHHLQEEYKKVRGENECCHGHQAS